MCTSLVFPSVTTLANDHVYSLQSWTCAVVRLSRTSRVKCGCFWDAASWDEGIILSKCRIADFGESHCRSCTDCIVGIMDSFTGSAINVLGHTFLGTIHFRCVLSHNAALGILLDGDFLTESSSNDNLFVAVFFILIGLRCCTDFGNFWVVFDCLNSGSFDDLNSFDGFDIRC